MISCENLTRKYGDFTAVEDVSFSIGKGEIVGLLGHNGAGKTTIMKVLTGFLEPTDGTVNIDGVQVLESRLEVQQKIGYLPENCPLYGEMTVVDYLEYVCELRGMQESNRASAIVNVIRRTRLEEKATSVINTLSRGYRQRVGVAQAIIHKPEILILDEPTNGLDPSQIHEMRSLIQELSEGATVILSTHILQEVQAVCDRVIIILHGHVALDSRIEDLQQSTRLMLSVSGSVDQLKGKLINLHGLKSVEPLRQHGDVQEFAIDIEPNGHAIAPEIARAVIDQGLQLHALHPERRDLETVFRDINSQTGSGA